jgi:hypothetical protein
MRKLKKVIKNNAFIDAHSHVHPEKKGFGEKYDASTDNLLESMAEAGACLAIILPIHGMVDNKFVSQTCNKHPDKLIGFASANPKQGKDSARELLEEMKQLGLRGIKLHPKRQDFHLNDRNVTEFFHELDNKSDHSVVLDCWFSERDELSARETVKFIKNNQFKRLKIILAHAGGFFYKKIIPLASRDDVYVDISYSPMTFNRFGKEEYIRGFFTELKKIGGGKIIFGSDFPECDILETKELVEGLLDKYGFTPEDKSKIFSGNIERLVLDKNKIKENL